MPSQYSETFPHTVSEMACTQAPVSRMDQSQMIAYMPSMTQSNPQFVQSTSHSMMGTPLKSFDQNNPNDLSYQFSSELQMMRTHYPGAPVQPQAMQRYASNPMMTTESSQNQKSFYRRFKKISNNSPGNANHNNQRKIVHHQQMSNGLKSTDMSPVNMSALVSPPLLTQVPHPRLPHAQREPSCSSSDRSLER